MTADATFTCATCDVTITHHPVFHLGLAFCCAGCAADGPCMCSYDVDRAAPAVAVATAHAPAAPAPIVAPLAVPAPAAAVALPDRRRAPAELGCAALAAAARR